LFGVLDHSATLKMPFRKAGSCRTCWNKETVQSWTPTGKSPYSLNAGIGIAANHTRSA
jgi:hypothetical protein